MSDRLTEWRLLSFLAPACCLMLAGLLVPFATIVAQSLGEPPGFDAYARLLGSALFRQVVLTTFEISVAATFCALLVGYPIALHLSRVSERKRRLLAILVLLPFWTSILVKSYSYIVMLGEAGLINQALAVSGLPKAELIFNRPGVLIGMTNFLTPFVVFPLLSNLLAQDANLRKAAEVMGASDTHIFWTITFPLSIPGLMAGAIICFVLSLGFFVTPALLGGRKDMMVANLVDFYTRESLDWAAASAIAVMLLITTGLMMLLLSRVRGRRSIL